MEFTAGKEMDKPIFFVDCDGCLASQGKIWRTKGDPHNNELEVQKVISDHDSWAIDKVKEHAHIIIISGDRRINEEWAARRGIPFIFTAKEKTHADKWSYLTNYCLDELKMDLPIINKYYYLGDTLADYTCMKGAKEAFYPQDASRFLKREADKHSNFIQLMINSGDGVFEAMIDYLVYTSKLSLEIIK